MSLSNSNSRKEYLSTHGKTHHCILKLKVFGNSPPLMVNFFLPIHNLKNALEIADTRGSWALQKKAVRLLQKSRTGLPNNYQLLRGIFLSVHKNNNGILCTFVS